MRLPDPAQLATLRDWFLPERVSWTVGLHVIRTGNGACLCDRWPDPRALLVDCAGNYALLGDPEALTPEDLRSRIAGFVHAPQGFAPLLNRAFPDLQVWHRVVYELLEEPRSVPSGDAIVRRLVSTDVHHLWGLTPGVRWITKTWGGPAGLASSGYAWGAFAGDRLVSLACTFFVGERYEELGVVTEPGFGGRGLSTACAQGLCRDVQGRGRRPTWSTSPDNAASVRVAEKLGFAFQCHDHLYVTGVSIPAAVVKNTPMHAVLEELAGGDRRSIGRAHEVVREVLENPALFPVVFNGMLSDDPLIRMRAADVVEKVTVDHPEYLAGHKAPLIDQVAFLDQQEVRWHVAQMIPRLALSQDERRRVVAILQGYLQDESRIVKTMALQALADLAEGDEALVPEVIARLEAHVHTDSPAVRSRARKLLSKLRPE